MTTKHTPGPWAVERNVKAGNVIHLAITARQNGKDWMVCSVTPEAWARPLDLANAELIAAAPELLEALILVMNDTTVRFSTVRKGKPLAQIIQDAITKATG